MAKFQTLIFVLLFSGSAYGRSTWGAEISYAGYLGDYAAGAIHEWDDTHTLHLSLGVYTIDETDYTQFNVGYTYRFPWNHRFTFNEDINWRLIDAGAYILRSLDNTHYFRSSPDKYPTSGYYDETALRFGFRVGTSFTFFDDTTQLSYFFMVLDNGLISWYNNQRERDLISYFVSHGISLSYRF